MASIVRMPEVLAGATEATLQAWLVSPGDRVSADQALAEAETEKALVELPAEFDGVVGRLLASVGDAVQVGVPIAVLLADGEGEDAIAAALAAAGIGASSGVAPMTVPAGEVASVDRPVSAAAVERRIFASPLIRRLAAEQGVDLGAVPGTGPNGRVVRRDLDRHVESFGAREPIPAIAAPIAPALSVAATYEDVPLDRMRTAIARRLSESKATVPHFYVVADCRVDALLQLREQVNAAASGKVSVNDFVIKAVAGALGDVPVANAIWNGDSIRRFSSADLSVAVATDGGLVTPVLRDVENLSLSAVATAVADLAARARAGRLRQHELEGGSFSISNLGMYGTQEFSAILNPPQSGILAVGAARKVPVVDAADELTVGAVMTVTLSADHRVIDGAVAAQWLAAFKQRIENPLSILI